MWAFRVFAQDDLSEKEVWYCSFQQDFLVTLPLYRPASLSCAWPFWPLDDSPRGSTQTIIWCFSLRCVFLTTIKSQTRISRRKTCTSHKKNPPNLEVLSKKQFAQHKSFCFQAFEWKTACHFKNGSAFSLRNHGDGSVERLQLTGKEWLCLSIKHKMHNQNWSLFYLLNFFFNRIFVQVIRIYNQMWSITRRYCCKCFFGEKLKNSYNPSYDQWKTSYCLSNTDVVNERALGWTLLVVSQQISVHIK